MFGKNVRRRRRANGWSQEHLAFECGLKRSYLSDIERGIRNPTLGVVERIAEQLKMAPWELLREQPDEPDSDA